MGLARSAVVFSKISRSLEFWQETACLAFFNLMVPRVSVDVELDHPLVNDEL